MSLSLAILAAAPFADLAAIDAQVAQFTGAAAGEEGGAVRPVDRRLRLQDCEAMLDLRWNTASRQTVVVQCPDTDGWRIFVPVRSVSVAAQAEKQVPVVNRGDSVAIAVAGRGFSVSQPGEALESGSAGDWIRVRKAGEGRRQSGDTLRALVVRPGLVRLSLP